MELDGGAVWQTEATSALCGRWGIATVELLPGRLLGQRGRRIGAGEEDWRWRDGSRGGDGGLVGKQ